MICPLVVNVVAGPEAVDDALRAQLVGATAHQRVVALVLTGVEVLGRAAVVGTEAAAVVPVRAGEEPPVAALAQQRVPHAAELRAVDAGATVGRAADRVGGDAGDVVAQDRVFTTVGRSAVTGLGFETERDPAAPRCSGCAGARR